MLTGTDQKKKKNQQKPALSSQRTRKGTSQQDRKLQGGKKYHSTPDKHHRKNCGPPRPTKVRYNKLRLPYTHQAVTRHPKPLHNGVVLRRPSREPRLSSMSAGNKAPFHTMFPQNPGPLTPPGRNRTLYFLGQGESSGEPVLLLCLAVTRQHPMVPPTPDRGVSKKEPAKTKA